MTKRKTHEQFIAEMSELHPGITVLGQYVTSQTKVDCLCAKCGHMWSPKPNDLLNGHGCPKCAGRAKKTDEEFRAELETLAPTVQPLSPYKGTMQKIECECLVCGHIWHVTPNHLLRGSGCPKCGGNHKRTPEEFSEGLKAVNPTIELIGEYVDTQTKTLFRCKTCGKEWLSKPIRILGGDRGCPACGVERVKEKLRKSQSSFVDELNAINPSIIVLGKYVNSRTPIKCRCAHCGSEWSTAPNALLNGTGCPSCSHTSTSYAEQFLLAYLTRIANGERVLSRDRGLIDMELDIVLPSRSLAIEIGSWFWHADKIERDRQRYERCKRLGVRLITIYDAFPSDIPAPNLEDCRIYEGNLGELKNRELLKDLAIFIAREAGCAHELTDTEWSTISDKAYANSRAKTTESYSRELSHINPSVEIVGEYKGSQVKVLCRCRNCGFEWETKPANLSQGRACPECAKKKAGESRRKTDEEFKAELARINPNVKVHGKYSNNKTPLKCVCKICGHEWNGVPSSLLNGSGCPKCAGVLKKSHQDFVAEMAHKHPTIKVIGLYNNSNDKVKCHCLTCGCEWEGIPAQMLSANTGCPTCGRQRVIKKLRKSHEQFQEELAEKNPNIEVVGTYVNSTTKIECRCSICGHLWSAVPASLLRGHGCPSCAKKSRAKRQTKSMDQFCADLSRVNAAIKPIGIYRGASEKIDCECSVCGYRWTPIASNLLHGAGCPKCAGKARKTTEEFIVELREKNPSVEVLGQYISSKEKILCRCRKCGYEWRAAPNNLLRGTGCPSCAHNA